MLLSIFDSELISTFKELFTTSDLHELKSLIDMKAFIIVGACLGYLWLINYFLKIVFKSVRAFFKGLKS